MAILLDTNALLWFLMAPNRLGKQTAKLLSSEPDLYASSLSIAELKIKEMKGKLSLPPELEKLLTNAQVEIMGFNSAHAIEMGRFGSLADHDPFDRMILSQASFERINLVTADRRLLGLGLDFVLDAEN
jgi:PIN domain nuclease of toxin-antitoxin system